MTEFIAVVFWIAAIYIVIAYGVVLMFAIMLTEGARHGNDPASLARTAWRLLPWAPVTLPLWIVAQRRVVMREGGDGDG